MNRIGGGDGRAPFGGFSAGFPQGRSPERASSIAAVPLVALFFLIAVGLGAIAVWSGEASRWPIAAAAAVLAFWMASLAWGLLRKTRP